MTHDDLKIELLAQSVYLQESVELSLVVNAGVRTFSSKKSALL